MLRGTWLPNQNLGKALSQWLLFRSNSLTLIGKGRLGAIISTIQAKKYSLAIQEKEGATETKPALSETARLARKSSCFPILMCALASGPSRGKLFQGPGSFSFIHQTYICTMPMVYRVS